MRPERPRCHAGGGRLERRVRPQFLAEYLCAVCRSYGQGPRRLQVLVRLVCFAIGLWASCAAGVTLWWPQEPKPGLRLNIPPIEERDGGAKDAQP